MVNFSGKRLSMMKSNQNKKLMRIYNFKVRNLRMKNNQMKSVKIMSNFYNNLKN